MIGIYTITNTINNKIYIGSSVNINRRLTQHKKAAKNGEVNKLYNSIRKYGIENFKFEIFEECSKEKLLEREQVWIDFFKPELNTCKVVGCGPVYTEEKNGMWKGGITSDPNYMKKYYIEYRKQNVEKKKEYQKEYYQQNKEKIKARRVQYRAKNAEKIKVREAQYRAKNVQKNNEYAKKYYQKNKEQL